MNQCYLDIKPDKDIMRKESYRPSSLMYVGAKILNEKPAK